ncbi:MAG: SUMF1/EgtB/PvdO family nonheme iron enzyme [Myxococcota bacterium]|nr:SUMF1/EgtB/PvdO family nonheme iron enzyme [Myxococcota bacterium]
MRRLLGQRSHESFRLCVIGTRRREALHSLSLAGDWAAARAGGVAVSEGGRFLWRHQAQLLDLERVDFFILALPLETLVSGRVEEAAEDALQLLASKKRGLIWAQFDETPPLGSRFAAMEEARRLLMRYQLCSPAEEPPLLIAARSDGEAALTAIERIAARHQESAPPVPATFTDLISGPLDTERRIEPGSIALASGKELTLPAPLSVSQTLLTWAQLESIGVRLEGSKRPSSDSPVEGLSCWEAAAICNLLSESSGLAPAYQISPEGYPTLIDGAQGYRLPTPREWLYFAFAGRMSLFSGGDDHDEVAWHLLNSASRVHPVAQRRPNAWGLYDCTGLLWEWCFQPTAAPGAPQPLCGGSWANRAPKLRLNQALMEDPRRADSLYGLRPVRAL